MASHYPKKKESASSRRRLLEEKRQLSWQYPPRSSFA